MSKPGEHASAAEKRASGTTSATNPALAPAEKVGAKSVSAPPSMERTNPWNLGNSADYLFGPPQPPRTLPLLLSGQGTDITGLSAGVHVEQMMMLNEQLRITRERLKAAYDARVTFQAEIDRLIQNNASIQESHSETVRQLSNINKLSMEHIQLLEEENAKLSTRNQELEKIIEYLNNELNSLREKVRNLEQEAKSKEDKETALFYFGEIIYLFRLEILDVLSHKLGDKAYLYSWESFITAMRRDPSLGEHLKKAYQGYQLSPDDWSKIIKFKNIRNGIGHPDISRSETARLLGTSAIEPELKIIFAKIAPIVEEKHL